MCLTNQCWLFVFPLFPCKDMQLVHLFILVFSWKLEWSSCRLWLFWWPFVPVQVCLPRESTRGQLKLSLSQGVLTRHLLLFLTDGHREQQEKFSVIFYFPSFWDSKGDEVKWLLLQYTGLRIKQVRIIYFRSVEMWKKYKNDLAKVWLVNWILQKHILQNRQQKMDWKLCCHVIAQHVLGAIWESSSRVGWGEDLNANPRNSRVKFRLFFDFHLFSSLNKPK